MAFKLLISLNFPKYQWHSGSLSFATFLQSNGLNFFIYFNFFNFLHPTFLLAKLAKKHETAGLRSHELRPGTDCGQHGRQHRQADFLHFSAPRVDGINRFYYICTRTIMPTAGGCQERNKPTCGGKAKARAMHPAALPARCRLSSPPLQPNLQS